MKQSFGSAWSLILGFYFKSIDFEVLKNALLNSVKTTCNDKVIIVELGSLQVVALGNC